MCENPDKSFILLYNFLGSFEFNTSYGSLGTETLVFVQSPKISNVETD